MNRKQLRPFFVRHKTIQASLLRVDGGGWLLDVGDKSGYSTVPRVLEELHDSHPRILKMKALARCHVWWPDIGTSPELPSVSVCETRASCGSAVTVDLAFSTMGSDSCRFCWTFLRADVFGGGRRLL